MKIIFLICIVLSPIVNSLGQSPSLGYNLLNKEQKTSISSFCLPNQEQYRTAILKNKWKINSENKLWIYFTATAYELQQSYLRNEIPNFYIEYAPPHLLNDSMRNNHNVDNVHNGIGLSSSYKGKGVIVGLVDTGIEVNHPDFKDNNNKTRILRYWDQSRNEGSTLSPYGYGIIWDSTQINAGLCTSIDHSGHGSSVAGAAVGNGRATGYNHGVAPEADIIMIKTSFSLPNWTLTVADAIEYVFKVADSLGKKAVINLSVGSYLGSHDGRDPAGLRISDLLNEKNGRIVVAAAGNSGHLGKYHCSGQVTSDTTFVWFQNNPNSSFGENKIFFDLFSDSIHADYHFSIKAIDPQNNYTTKSFLNFRHAMSSLDNPIYDTLKNNLGQRIATVEIYTAIEGENYHLQALFKNIDSTNYLYGFYTYGSGSYDIWSGQAFGYNKMVELLPSNAILPSISNYQLPDAQQTVISSWNSSPNVVSVANLRNRHQFLNYLGELFPPTNATPVGHLSISSSKGPNRHNHIKPDIAASGEVTLSPFPIHVLQEPLSFQKMDKGGWHSANGGTSMASPVVAGVAALFLEKCPKGNNITFLEALKNFSSSNAYTGILPNNAYGYGSINAHNLLTNQEYSVNISGFDSLCLGPNVFDFHTTETISSVEWSNGNTAFSNTQYTAGEIYVKTYNSYGCEAISDTIHLVQISPENIQPIEVSEDFLTLSTTSTNQVYQWTYNEVDIPGETNPTLELTSINSGIYDCYTIDANGCRVYAGGVGIFLSINEIEKNKLLIFPNPSNDEITIQSETPILSVTLFEPTRKQVTTETTSNNKLKINTLSDGIYYLQIKTKEGIHIEKIIKR